MLGLRSGSHRERDDPVGRGAHAGLAHDDGVADGAEGELAHACRVRDLDLGRLRGEPHEPFRIANFEAPPEATTKPLYFDTDLVLVSHEQLDLERVDDEGQLVPQQFHALALVNGSSPGTLALKLYLP